MRSIALALLVWLVASTASGDVIFPGDGPRRRRWPAVPVPTEQPADPPSPPEIVPNTEWHPNVEEEPELEEDVGFAVVSGLALVGLAAFALSRDRRLRRRPLHV